MRHKPILVAVLVIILIAAGAVIVVKHKTQTATSYEDAGGWVYTCSKPVRVKDQGVTYANGKPSLTPVNPSDAAKYCQRMGIE